MQSYPNQRMIHVHREHATHDFLGIKNENWQAAARDLGETALALYMYLASNRNDYEFALSQVAVKNAIGMKKSTYYDQFNKLVAKGYLVNTHGNTFEFFEVPQSATGNGTESGHTNGGQKIPVAEQFCPPSEQSIPQKNREINKEQIPKDVINIKIFSSLSSGNQEEEIKEDFLF